MYAFAQVGNCQQNPDTVSEQWNKYKLDQQYNFQVGETSRREELRYDATGEEVRQLCKFFGVFSKKKNSTIIH